MQMTNGVENFVTLGIVTKISTPRKLPAIRCIYSYNYVRYTIYNYTYHHFTSIIICTMC